VTVFGPLRCSTPSSIGNISTLAFSVNFYFHRSVLAKDNGASLSTIDSAAARQNGGAAFVTTHWSMVVAAQGDSPAAHKALENLCRTYWRPLYAFVRQQGYKHEEAEDFTQGFFAVLLERKGFDSLRKEKGRLRSFLLVSLKNFLADEHRVALAIKRGRGQRPIPLEDLRKSAEADFEPSDPSTAEQIYERRWASTLLAHVFAQLKDDYYKAGNAELFEWLKQLLPDEPGAPSPADIAAKTGMTENAVRQAFYRFRLRYQSILREEIARTVATPNDVEDELRNLISVLRA
jgi:DNA-directed RNA polymerase specialized sigma24 family protein